MYYRYPILFVLFLLLAACGEAPTSSTDTMEAAATEIDSAQQVVDRAIARHGGDLVENSRIEFDFRKRHYVATRRGDQYTYERIWRDTTTGQQYRDVLSNAGLYREIDGQRVSLSAKDSAAYARSTNSVIYFALLPYFLNDPAVRKTYLGITDIKGRPYHKIKVTFVQEGGGRDFEDEYIYWIHRDDYTMDYLAYNYIVDGGGARFREAYNVREIDGIRFADYINYEPQPDSREVAAFDSLFTEGNLKELSRIDTENITVEQLEDAG